MKAKNLNQLNTLAQNFHRYIDPSSGYRSRPYLHKQTLDGLSNSQALKQE
jgi:hypothetical protein